MERDIVLVVDEHRSAADRIIDALEDRVRISSRDDDVEVVWEG